MMNVDLRSRPGAAVPSLYIQTGLLFLCGACALIVLQAPAVMLMPRHNPATLVLTHLFALGFGTLITFGALFQMIPVILGERLAAEHPARVAYAHFVPGLLLQVMGFATWTPWLIAAGGSLVAAGTLIFTVPYLKPLARKARTDHTALFILASLLYVALTVLLGVALAVQLHTVWSGRLFTWGLPLHMLAGGLGWFTGIIIGVSYKLFPMFTTTQRVPDRNVYRVFLLFQSGLFLALATGALGWRGGLTAGLLLVTASLLLYVLDVRRMLKARLRRRLSPGMQQSALAVLHLVGAALLAGVLVAAGLAGSAGPQAVWQRLGIAAGLWFAFGWIGSMVLGMLSKIVPMLVWLDRYADRAGDPGVPAIADLVDDRALRLGGAAYQAGCIGLLCAVAAGYRPLTLAAAAVLLFGAAYLTATVFQVWHPAPAATPSGHAAAGGAPKTE